MYTYLCIYLVSWRYLDKNGILHKIMNDLLLRFISQLRFIISEFSYKRSSLGISYGIGMSIADI